MKKAIITISILIYGLISLFSQDLEPPLNLDLYADRFDVYLFWEAPNTTLQVLDYNIYKNGIFLDNTNDTSFIDNVEYCSEISYYITAVYEIGESLPSEIEVINISYCWIEQIFDDMENYSIGEQIACQNNLDWTTWSNLPCSEEDAFITDEVAYSNNGSICIEEGTDLVYPINNYTYGVYTIRFYMYIPVGYDAYFNTLQEFEPIPSWGMQVYFDVGGVGSIDAGGASAATFSFPYNTWFLNEIYIDLESDWAQYSINNEEIHEWVWSLGTFGQIGPCQLGGSNFFTYAGGSGQSKCFIDDYLFGAPTTCIPQPPSNLEVLVANNDVSFNWTAPGGNCELLGFIIYKNDINIAYTTDIFFDEFNLTPGEYEYYITAVYNNFEAFSSDTVLVEISNSILFFDDFENYNLVDQLACQIPENWTTWNNMPCTNEDPFVTDTFAFSGTNSVLILDSNDLVFPMNNYTSGKYKISFYMYIPFGERGVFSVLKLFDGDNSEVGVQMNFNSDGYLDIEFGSTGQQIFYNPGTWMKNEITIDLDEDWADYYLDNELLVSWQWSLGIVPNLSLQLAGVNFKADFWTIENAKYFIDDYMFVELDTPCLDPPQNVTYSIVNPSEVLVEWEAPNCPDLLGYNVYFEGILLGFTTGTSYLSVLPPGTYEVCITAVYEMDESECALITIIITNMEEMISNDVNISPNPTKDIVQIESKKVINEAKLYDLNGCLKMEISGINTANFIFSVGDFNPGVYILFIETEIEVVHYRLIVQ